jgi:hypothetical protein
VSMGFSSPFTFMSPPRPAAPGRTVADEVAGTVTSPEGEVLLLGLPKNPRGAKVSHLAARFWPGVDPNALTLVDEYRRPRSFPSLVSLHRESALTALVESWLWMSARLTPRTVTAVKVRCDFSVGSHWCVLESPGTIITKRGGRDEARQARRAEESKVRSAIMSLAGTRDCAALGVFSSPAKFRAASHTRPPHSAARAMNR